jgi:hypothetical protein
MRYGTKLAERTVIERQFGQTGSGPMIIEAPELSRTRITTYSLSDGKTATGATDNFETIVQPAANYMINAKLAEFQLPSTLDVQFSGLIDFELDGLRQQISWEVGDSGAFTRISMNTEHDLAIPSYAERRRQLLALPISQNPAAQRAISKIANVFTYWW